MEKIILILGLVLVRCLAAPIEKEIAKEEIQSLKNLQIPGFPDIPEKLQLPGMPNIPGIPQIPGMQNILIMLQIFGMLENPKMPQIPGFPKFLPESKLVINRTEQIPESPNQDHLEEPLEIAKEETQSLKNLQIPGFPDIPVKLQIPAMKDISRMPQIPGVRNILGMLQIFEMPQIPGFPKFLPESKVVMNRTEQIQQSPNKDHIEEPLEIAKEETQSLKNLQIPAFPDIQEKLQIPGMPHIPGIPQIPGMQNILIMLQIFGMLENPEMPQIPGFPKFLPESKVVMNRTEQIPESPNQDHIEKSLEISKEETQSLKNLQIPGFSDIPVKLQIPGMPDIPGMPQIPGMPDIPGMPQIPGMRNILGMLQIFGMPQIPGFPKFLPESKVVMNRTEEMPESPNQDHPEEPLGLKDLNIPLFLSSTFQSQDDNDMNEIDS